MHWADLILILTFVGAGFAVGYLILLHKIRQIVSERHLQVADQLAALDDAIRALETRLAEHHAAAELIAGAQSIIDSNSQDETRDQEQSEAVAPDVQAVITAAAVAAMGQDVHIRSIKPATSSWSQQGRVLVQGSHNARARR
jgi:6-phosphogluconolactonase/glucosamine-6-phosphate isomerase/deaminase